MRGINCETGVELEAVQNLERLVWTLKKTNRIIMIMFTWELNN